jgi:hypothetical protein
MLMCVGFGRTWLGRRRLRSNFPPELGGDSAGMLNTIRKRINLLVQSHSGTDVGNFPQFGSHASLSARAPAAAGAGEAGNYVTAAFQRADENRGTGAKASTGIARVL